MTLPMIHPDLPLDDAAPPGDALCARALVQRVRWGTGLSQDAFARTFRIDPDALCEMEAGRSRPDLALRAYLKVIEHAPTAVLEALGDEDGWMA
jgi:putative transcriptional regulator